MSTPPTVIDLAAEIDAVIRATEPEDRHQKLAEYGWTWEDWTGGSVSSPMLALASERSRIKQYARGPIGPEPPRWRLLARWLWRRRRDRHMAKVVARLKERSGYHSVSP